MLNRYIAQRCMLNWEFGEKDSGDDDRVKVKVAGQGVVERNEMLEARYWI